MQIKECFEKLNLWKKTGLWIHNDTANKIIADYFVTHVGTQEYLDKHLTTSCRQCNKWREIYKFCYNHYQNNN